MKAAFAQEYDTEAYILSISDPVYMLRAGKKINIDNRTKSTSIGKAFRYRETPLY